jgi:LEA14-like dessication related protein
MPSARPFKLGLSLALLLAVLAACAGVGTYTERPKVSLLSMALTGATPLEQRFAIKLRVTNPNDADLDITGLSLELEVNEVALATVVSDQFVKVPRFSSAVLEAEAAANLLVLPKLIKEAGRSGGALRYRIKGAVVLGTPASRNLASTVTQVTQRLPFDHKGEFQLEAR